MKCLSEVVAVDPSILARVSLPFILHCIYQFPNLYTWIVLDHVSFSPWYISSSPQLDMQRGVHGRLMDNSTSVREAAVELLGRFVLSRPQLTEQYYDMLIERILVNVLQHLHLLDTWVCGSKSFLLCNHVLWCSNKLESDLHVLPPWMAVLWGRGNNPHRAVKWNFALELSHL